MENNRECYHCAANHPELTIPLFAYGFGFSPDELDDDRREHAGRYETLRRSRTRRWECLRPALAGNRPARTPPSPASAPSACR